MRSFSVAIHIIAIYQVSFLRFSGRKHQPAPELIKNLMMQPINACHSEPSYAQKMSVSK